MKAMAKENGTDSLRTRLIEAGIEEISAHGIADFSLRRVAAACQVSCAAPYRHFHNREEFISATVAYINSQWGLLRNNILRLWPSEPRKQLTELCVAYIRFLVANDNYRSVLVASGEHWEENDRMADLMAQCAAARSEQERQRMLYAMRALIYGTVAMLESGELANEDATFEMFRTALYEIIQ